MAAENPWARHGIGRRFKDAALENVARKYFSGVFDYEKNAQQYLTEGRGLILSGPPGIGKTYALVALMKTLHAKIPRFDFLFATAPGMFDIMDKRDARDTYRNRSWTATLELIPALVINDLGKEDRSREWLAEQVVVKFGRILRARHEEQLPIFITTNLALDAPKSQRLSQTVQSVYGDSLWSLLHDMTVFRAQTNAPDRRRTTDENE